MTLSFSGDSVTSTHSCSGECKVDMRQTPWRPCYFLKPMTGKCRGSCEAQSSHQGTLENYPFRSRESRWPQGNTCMWSLLWPSPPLALSRFVLCMEALYINIYNGLFFLPTNWLIQGNRFVREVDIVWEHHLQLGRKMLTCECSGNTNTWESVEEEQK